MSSHPSVTSVYAVFLSEAQKRKLRPKTKAWYKLRRKGISAEFEDYLGDMNQLESWQQLCADLAIEAVPRSITQARKVSSSVLQGHV
jgi:hypothetical protein